MSSCRDGIVSGASDLTTSASSVVATAPGQPAGLERRVAWLEEDVAVLHRRQRDDCGVAEATRSPEACGDLALHELVRRLDGELQTERRAREALEARQRALEEAFRAEQRARESHMRTLSSELRATVDELVHRVDWGLCAGVATMRERTDQVEVKLRSLLQRVDEGASGSGGPRWARSPDPAGRRSPAGRLPAPCAAPPAARPAGCPAGAGGDGPVTSDPDRLIHDWDELRQENQRLREMRARQLRGAATAAAPQGAPCPAAGEQPRGGAAAAAAPWGSPGLAAGEGLTPFGTPCLAEPSTLQVPGSGVAAGAGGVAVAPYGVERPFGRDPFGFGRGADDAASRPRLAGAAAPLPC